MDAATGIIKRLTLGNFDHGAAAVALDGQIIGQIVRERPGFYGSLLFDRAAGGGRNIPNALKSLAVNCAVEFKQGRAAALAGAPFNVTASAVWQRAYAEALQDLEH